MEDDEDDDELPEDDDEVDEEVAGTSAAAPDALGTVRPFRGSRTVFGGGLLIEGAELLRRKIFDLIHSFTSSITPAGLPAKGFGGSGSSPFRTSFLLRHCLHPLQSVHPPSQVSVSLHFLHRAHREQRPPHPMIGSICPYGLVGAFRSGAVGFMIGFGGGRTHFFFADAASALSGGFFGFAAGTRCCGGSSFSFPFAFALGVAFGADFIACIFFSFSFASFFVAA